MSGLLRDAGDADIPRPAINQDTDPGAIGAGRAWIDTTTGELRIRNAADDGWILVGRQAAAQADSTATDTAGIVSDFNDLLAKLRAVGLLDS